jgi:hypothetical protein
MRTARPIVSGLAGLRKQRIEAMSYDRLIMNVADRLEIEDQKLIAPKKPPARRR